MVKALQIVDEEEQFIFLDRATDVAAQVVVGEMSYEWIEIVASIKVVASKELVSGAVKVVAAGLEDNVGYGAAGTAEFRLKIAGRDVDGLDGFEGRDADLEQPRALVVVNSFDLVVVAHAELAVDFGLQGAAGIEKLRVLERGARRARDEVQKILKVAVGAERHVLRQNGFELAAGVGAFRLKDGSFRFDRDGFRYVARLEIQIDARSCIYDDVDAGAGGALEAGEFRNHAIGTRRQIRENVIAAFV